MKRFVFAVFALSLLGTACSSNTTVDSDTVADAVDNAAQSPAPANDAEADEPDPAGDSTDSTEPEADADAEDEPVADEPEEPADEPENDNDDTALSAEQAAAVQAVVEADDWCVVAAAVEDGTAGLDDVDFTDPIALEQTYKQAQAVVAAAQRLAPPEIAADVQQTIEGFTALNVALEDVNWSFLDLDLSVMEALDDDMELATYNIERYNFDVCAIGEDPGAAPVPGDGTTDDAGDAPFQGTIRDQAVQGIVAEGFTQEEAECVVDGLDFSNPDALADPAAIIAVFTECNIPLDRLAEIGGG